MEIFNKLTIRREVIETRYKCDGCGKIGTRKDVYGSHPLDSKGWTPPTWGCHELHPNPLRVHYCSDECRVPAITKLYEVLGNQ